MWTPGRIYESEWNEWEFLFFFVCGVVFVLDQRRVLCVWGRCFLEVCLSSKFRLVTEEQSPILPEQASVSTASSSGRHRRLCPRYLNLGRVLAQPETGPGGSRA